MLARFDHVLEPCIDTGKQCAIALLDRNAEVGLRKAYVCHHLETLLGIVPLIERQHGHVANGGVDTSAVQTFTITLGAPSIRRFEFNASPVLQTAGYTSVRASNLYDETTGPLRTFGWNSVVTEADRPNLPGNTLLRDGHYSRDNTFTAELPNGTYTVSIVVGDKSFVRDRLNVYANGVLVPSLTNLTTAAGQFVHKSFTATITNERLSLRLKDMGGDPFWMLHALEIRPALVVQNTLTITRVNPTGTGALAGDGVSIDTYQGQNATPNALLSVSATAGILTTSQDQDPNFSGIQVRANASGQFFFQVQRPTAIGSVTSTR